jgi:signal transduction histidine kinase
LIAAAVLATGLLLVLAGVASARIPGGASLARPGIPRVRAFVLSPIAPATWYANASVWVGLFVGALGFGMVATLASAGVSILLAGVGLVLIALAIETARAVARIERWRLSLGQPARLTAHPYRPLRGGFVEVLRAEFLDESRWRDVLYIAVDLPLVVLELAVVVVAWSVALFFLTSPIWYDAEAADRLNGILQPVAGHDPVLVALRFFAGLALLPVAASLSQLVVELHRAVVRALLCTSESRELRRQVETLRESRSAVIDVEATELSRIERDLHDGAQQRLVALTIDLGRASERLETDPDGAKALILEGQAQAREALAEIRDLVRGIAPSILLDRGLVAALESVAGRASIPTTVVSRLAPGARLSPAAERTAYFVASEALANVAKHAGATRCEVRCRREGGRLIVEVRDDGHGGAAVVADGGLAGLQSRVAGVDGRLVVSSPAGGPTLIRAEIPIPG